ncbi:MAG: hypothetical protein RJA70_1527 [Pseudomonadota bacterium]|jgi:hypothetical protein
MSAFTETGFPFPTLYKHDKRKHWGLALLGWAHDNKRGYLFQDGQLRVFGEEFCGMMLPITDVTDEMRDLAQRLLVELGGMIEQKPSASADPDAMTVTEQIGIFRGDYPKGFADPEWLNSVRGEGSKSSLKRHRAPALELAKTELTREKLEEIASEPPGSVWGAIAAVLRKTELVPAKESRAVPFDDVDKLTVLDAAVFQMLYGEGDYELRFDDFLRAYEDAHEIPAGWQLATSISSLVHPGDHVVVRPGSFREQAKSVQYRLRLGRPSGRAYAESLSLARQVAERLMSAGQTPRDMIDVHDFMSHTTRASAKRQVLSQRASNAAGETPPTGAHPSKAKAA